MQVRPSPSANGEPVPTIYYFFPTNQPWIRIRIRLNHELILVARHRHDAHRFCPRCGSPTLPYLNGTRRTCAQDSSHKLYPRTDPVVIMLVESPDGHKALLGRGKRAGPGMYTALSGFVDQCESIEEAVAREVREEARVQVEGVQVLGSQPWPIGRFGGCELMIGCVAKASSYEILVNATEMDDVQWFERSDLAAAVQLYEENPEASLAEIQQFLVDTLGFWIPPPVTMAFHLVRSWVKAGRPFFAEPQAKL